jgi:hypothetical protein
MEIGYSKEEVQLFETVKKLFGTLYAKGILDYEAYLGHNNAYFAGKENKRATLVTIEIKPDLDKLNPLSPNYDPHYVDTIWKAANIEDIKKYLGAPNLIIETYYDWDSIDGKKWTEMSVKFQSITEEIVQKIISEYNLDMTSDYFYGLYNFGIYPAAWESEGKLTVDIESNNNLCTEIPTVVAKEIVESIVYEVLHKYNITENTVLLNNQLCKSQGN